MAFNGQFILAYTVDGMALGDVLTGDAHQHLIERIGQRSAERIHQ